MASALPQRSTADGAFERLYRRHAGDVYRYALAVLRDPADAEDVTQIVFLQAYRAYKRGERPRRPHNWLIVIARNACRQWFRQLARRPRGVALDADALAAPAHDGPTAQDIVRGLRSLAANHQAVLVMRELEGRSYSEIAAAMEISVAAVETLMFRARRALREQLESGLTCSEAETAVSEQLAGLLPRGGKRLLRAHLRECPECAARARSRRAQRRLGGLIALPFPPWLLSLFGGGAGGAATTATTVSVTSGVMAKVAIVAGTATVAFGLGNEAVHHRPAASKAPTAPTVPVIARAATPAAAAPAKPVRRSVVAVHTAARSAHPSRAEPVPAKASHSHQERPATSDKAARNQHTGRPARSDKQEHTRSATKLAGATIPEAKGTPVKNHDRVKKRPADERHKAPANGVKPSGKGAKHDPTSRKQDPTSSKHPEPGRSNAERADKARAKDKQP